MYFILNHWPLTFLCAAMIVAAVIDGWKLKVPNWLTFPLILSGWALGLLNNFDLLVDAGFEGGLGAALLGTGLGFLLLLPVYAIGGMGAGDVKMQMGFGSWVGAFYGAKEGLWIIWWAFAVAAIVGGLIAVVMIALRGDLKKNLSTARTILGDVTQKGVEGAAESAAKRKPQAHLLPYGIPLCLGFIGHLVFRHGWGG